MSLPNEPSVIYDFDPRNLPPEYLRAIGLVTAAAAQTESILQKFLGGLLGIDSMQSMALTLHMSMPLKDDIIRSLAHLGAPDLKELDKIDDLLDTIKSAFKNRNYVVHDSFAMHPETKKVFRVSASARGTLEAKLIPVSVKEIEKHASTLYESGMDLMRFMSRRDIMPTDPTRPIREAVDRSKKARKVRRDGKV